MFPKDQTSQKNLARANTFDPLPGSGTIMDRTKNIMVAVYDFAVLGGAISTIPLVDDQGNPAVLPQGAYVTNVVAHVITACVGVSGTLSLGTNLAASVVDLVAATAVASLTIGANIAGVPVGTAATWKGPITAVGGNNIVAAIATTPFTAGKVYFVVEYIVLNIA